MFSSNWAYDSHSGFEKHRVKNLKVIYSYLYFLYLVQANKNFSFLYSQGTNPASH